MSDTFFEDFFRRHLKELGSKEIENAIKKAICDLTGVEYIADVLSIDFEPVSNAGNNDMVEIKLRLKKYIEPFKVGAENA
jgi:hypothetical protein